MTDRADPAGPADRADPADPADRARDAGGLDVERLAALSGELGMAPDAVVDTLVDELDGALARTGEALRTHDLAAAADAAHAARNSALMIDAGGLLEALRTLESAARHGRPTAAAAAADRVRAIWPGVRAALRRAASKSRRLRET